MVLPFIEMGKTGVAEWVAEVRLPDEFNLGHFEFKTLVEYGHPDIYVDKAVGYVGLKLRRVALKMNRSGSPLCTNSIEA